MHAALDATDVRALAEFYRDRLTLHYRAGDEPPGDGGPDSADWLVLVDGDAQRVLAFQHVDVLARPTWPSEVVSKQIHLDFRVDDLAGLEHHRRRAESLGAVVLLDRSGDQEEPLFVLSDPAGHPFCLLVSTG